MAVLGPAHGPDDGAGAVIGQGLGDPVQVLLGDARDVGDRVGVVLGHHRFEIFKPVRPLVDRLPIFPAVLQYDVAEP